MKKLLLFIFALAILCPLTVIAQDAPRIVISPENPEVSMGEELLISAILIDSAGNSLEESPLFFSRTKDLAVVSREGKLTALRPGNAEIIAYYFGDNGERIRESFNVIVNPIPVTTIEFINPPASMYATTTVALNTIAQNDNGVTRPDVEVKVKSNNPEIALIDELGELKALKPGNASITATAEDVTETITVTVKNNPVANIGLTHNYEGKTVRTGDVITFKASPKTASGKLVNDIPVDYSFIAYPNDELGQGASALIEQNGKFVANHPGKYTVLARVGNNIAEQSFRVVPRNIQRPISVVGKGIIPDVKTSDLWVWEGVDGRDYAVTGTWGARGEAFFWDVTDPSDIYTIDTVKVDARTVNDVKVSEDGRIAVITREGASNRKNGIIILDVTNPRDVKILSEYTTDLTGGVHNSFIYEDHVYAVNNGRKYDIINIEDPTNPYTVSVFELDTPGHSIHDVWIEDGIAYSSNWSDGIVAVDIGSNTSADMPGAGGSPENPVQLGSYTYPSGWNHAAFPFKSKSTGDFYVAAGDEAFPYGLDRGGPNRAAGWIHFIKFDGWDNPEEVARYQVPEAGSHNYWIKDDVLYAAFYNGGLRIVDISGELMGNLYEQGREIAMYVPTDPNAVIPNAAFTWGPQPYKGHIFMSDWNSGLWVLKLGETTAGGTN